MGCAGADNPTARTAAALGYDELETASVRTCNGTRWLRTLSKVQRKRQVCSMPGCRIERRASLR